MKKKPYISIALAGFCAGAVNGLFGAAGGMVLIPLLTRLTDLEGQELFASSIAIILPICIVSLVFTEFKTGLDWQLAFPYLIGSAAGGILAGIFGKKIPALWLHRGLGILILWGGIRYLCG